MEEKRGRDSRRERKFEQSGGRAEARSKDTAAAAASSPGERS